MFDVLFTKVIHSFVPELKGWVFNALWDVRGDFVRLIRPDVKQIKSAVYVG